MSLVRCGELRDAKGSWFRSTGPQRRQKECRKQCALGFLQEIEDAGEPGFVAKKSSMSGFFR